MGTHFLGKRSVLLEELNYAISQLRMIHAETLDLVERYQNPCEEEFVFLFQRQCKTIDDRAKDLQ